MRDRWTCVREEALERNVLPSWRATRTRRRALVVAGTAAMAMIWAGAIVSWNLAPSDTAMYTTISLLAVSVVITVTVVTLLNTATRGMISLSERRLDERQVAERLRAHTVAHRVMMALLVVLVVVVLNIGDGREEHVPIAAIVVGVVALLETHLLMPLLVAGWRQPDPPPDDDDRGDGAPDVAR